MRVLETISRKFASIYLSHTKYNAMAEVAASLRNVRNQLSRSVAKDPLKYVEMGKYDFQKLMLPLIRDKVLSCFTKQVCDDVWVAYSNKFKQTRKKIQFRVIKTYKLVKYKRMAKKHKIGELKAIEKTTRTPD